MICCAGAGSMPTCGRGSRAGSWRSKRLTESRTASRPPRHHEGQPGLPVVPKVRTARWDRAILSRLGFLARDGQMSICLRRRAFITLIGGAAAAAWPLAARAQQGDRLRRIGALMPFDENDPEGKRRFSAFTQALAGLGWVDGRNMRMDVRWGGGDTNRVRALAQELAGLQPDIILTKRDPGDCCASTGDANDPDRLCERERSHRQRHRRAA